VELIFFLLWSTHFPPADLRGFYYIFSPSLFYFLFFDTKRLLLFWKRERERERESTRTWLNRFKANHLSPCYHIKPGPNGIHHDCAVFYGMLMLAFLDYVHLHAQRTCGELLSFPFHLSLRCNQLSVAAEKKKADLKAADINASYQWWGVTNYISSAT